MIQTKIFKFNLFRFNPTDLEQGISDTLNGIHGEILALDLKHINDELWLVVLSKNGGK